LPPFIGGAASGAIVLAQFSGGQPAGEKPTKPVESSFPFVTTAIAVSFLGEAPANLKAAIGRCINPPIIKKRASPPVGFVQPYLKSISPPRFSRGEID
jgi:hypothetical protein